MRLTPAAMDAAWTSGDFTGPRRAIQRVTIQDWTLKERPVLDGGGLLLDLYAQVPLGQTGTPRELPNIRSVRWERTVDSPAASCTVTLWNTAPLALGEVPDADANFDQPGYYTFNRGATPYLPANTRWAHEVNDWSHVITENRMIRTYEGYGWDPAVGPDLDPHMVQSGVWIIDDVDLTVDGLITLTCRDLGWLLLEQIMFPPVVPMIHYPLQFETRHEVETTTVETTSGFSAGTLSTDSGEAGGYTGHDGSLYGHRPSHALDASTSTYWLSVGNANPTADYAFEWLEVDVTGSVSAVKVTPWGGPYRMYVSVFSTSANYPGGIWRGQAKIPYNPNAAAAAPNGANIPYVIATTVARDVENIVRFPTVSGVLKVRVTFASLFDSNLGPYQYRAGVRLFQVSQEVQTSVVTTSICGNIDDYSDIVKRLLAYAGFWWSPVAEQNNYEYTDGSDIDLTYLADDDPALEAGRVWGDIMISGTAPIAPTIDDPDLFSIPLGVEIWDKKYLMDGIAYVRDILGFNFFIDELGGPVFRFPNVRAVGNYIGDLAPGSVPPYVPGLTEMVILDEQENLLGLSVKLTGRQLRERDIVTNHSGTVGAMAAGSIFHPVNARRISVYSDMHFTDPVECKIMAELMSLRRTFTYRTTSSEIPGYSKIQIDDQVRIVEAITSEANVHYIKAITSSWEASTGVWTYTLETHWLGGAPEDDWAFTVEDLSAETQVFLEGLTRE